MNLHTLRSLASLWRRDPAAPARLAPAAARRVPPALRAAVGLGRAVGLAVRRLLRRAGQVA